MGWHLGGYYTPHWVVEYIVAELPEGPAIVAPNHNSVIDSFILPCVLPRRISYVGKAEYMDSWKTKYVFPAMGMVPIDRSGGQADLGVPFFPLIRLDVPAYAADALPPELAGLPAEKPGSRKAA